MTAPRPDCPAGAALIPLWRAGAVVAWAVVDADLFDELDAFKWRAYTKKWVYARRDIPLGKRHHSQVEFMHRRILPVEAPLVVDHINRNTLDNRRENLRPATVAQNAFNGGTFGAVPYRGVYRHNEKGREARPFMARIRSGSKWRFLGRFATAEEAARAYDRAALELAGAFAALNFPEEHHDAAD